MSNNTSIIRRARKGLSLVELMVAVAVIGLLSSLTFAVSTKVSEHAALTNESAVARNMVTAFLLFPQDNNGALMRGKGTEPRKNITGFDGLSLDPGEESAMRWPWKLANQMPGGAQDLFTSAHQDYYAYLRERHDAYGISLTPSLGLNMVFVGGNFRSSTLSPQAVTYASRRDREGTPTFPNDYCVTRPNIAYKPSELIVFVSTFSEYAENWEDIGYYIANAPITPDGMRWGSYNEDIPANMGFVHLRHNEKAVVAMLDGSVGLMGEDELRDMRHWSNQAARYDDANFENFSRN
ncbi:prepilin-type N-terminal cleavage/methylation domain-containing protein [Ruficoccus sp. ZRK36]|uniref:type II secretion system protein n=1 Tax=Ruficoccus sp. ZRK36 TaxID=2866311 RepID=UPI001C73B007|nr:prepilin-type N-terminal cleavage/methylation domain-containing protein [Ruficoccus sp. ZRK36]QYY34397.1 prepilin-type N-terminal cleavage/methylation domain-containing protein [Ruficoccus sp. ZRK36]